MKKSEMPVRSRKAPNMMNTAIYLEHTSMGVVKTPVEVKASR